MGKTIDDILNTLNVPAGQEKTASAAAPAGVEKKASLSDLYNERFASAPAAAPATTEKTAEMSKEAENAYMEKVGEIAGAAFTNELTFALMKVAADSESPEAAATGDKAGNPQLAVNRPADADKKLDTTPEHYDIKSLAMSKAELERKLEDPAKLEAPVLRQVDTGMETPTSQKQASAQLTREELALLSLQIPEGIMKEARAKVAQKGELEKVAHACVAYGQQLAMEKIAEMEEEAGKEKDKKKPPFEGTESKSEEEAEEEAVKEAQAMGRFITEGYLTTMIEKSAQVYGGDKTVYLNQLIKEAGIKDIVHKIKGIFRKGGKSANEGGKKSGNLK